MPVIAKLEAFATPSSSKGKGKFADLSPMEVLGNQIFNEKVYTERGGDAPLDQDWSEYNAEFPCVSFVFSAAASSNGLISFCRY